MKVILFLIIAIVIGLFFINKKNKENSLSNKLEKNHINVCDIVLISAGENEINVIKLIREFTGLSLIEAKTLVESAPKPIKEGAKKEEAEEIKAKLEAVGATVELK